LARNKFFVATGFAPLRARQNRSFARIAATDSGAAVFASRDASLPFMVNDRCTMALALGEDGGKANPQAVNELLKSKLGI
jgi:thiamine monophosphate synthase